MQSAQYVHYICSVTWRVKALDAKRRAGFRCALCDRHDGPLEVHHRTYARLGHELPEDLIVLCEECHRRHHGTLERHRQRLHPSEPWLPFESVPPQGPELN